VSAVTLFRVGGPHWPVRELTEADLPALQRLFESNARYFELISGQGPRADEAAQEFAELPPADMPYRRLWKLGFFTSDHGDAELAGMASVISDFIAPAVGHVGLFMLAAEHQGQGAALASYAALERWMQHSEGAQWLRLGIIVGNTRAERFWARCGYGQMRERGPVSYGLRQNMLRVMMKPLTGGAAADYLARVARDRPDAI
jgi:RimJ/RimL family protein N-acetyltransferase